MIIQCERCKTRFKIDDSKVKPTGSKVRCSRCGKVFFVTSDKGQSGSWVATEREVFREQPDIEFDTRTEKEGSYSDVTEGLMKKQGKEDFSQEVRQVHSRSVEASVGKQETTPQEKKEIPKEETSLPQKELKIDLEKEPIRLNRQRFASIREKEKEVNLKPPHFHSKEAEETLEVEKKEENSEFSWENLNINKEPVESLVEPPQLFNETPEEAKYTPPKRLESLKESGSGPLTSMKPTPDTLEVDKEKLLITQKETLKRGSYYVPTLGSRARASKRGALKKVASTIVIFLILIVMIGAAVTIAINRELIPKGRADRITTFILSKLPIGLIQPSRNEVVVSDHSGRWISTRNGFTYVVSGDITNKSKYVVNFVRVKSEFISDEERLFEQVVYAGNTFTDNELKTLPFEDILLKLNRKNGDINFDDPGKLAGLNYGIQPNESVPFFSVFPAKSKILGLKYNIEVVDFEKAPLE